jgi:hypothetical protein
MGVIPIKRARKRAQNREKRAIMITPRKELGGNGKGNITTVVEINNEQK